MLGEELALQVLVSGREGRRGRIAHEPEPRGDHRGGNDRVVVHADNP
jgi:hypothetical protein